MRQCDYRILYMPSLKGLSNVDVAQLAAEMPKLPLKLYAIRAVGTGRFKIGYSEQPGSRLQDLQIGSPLRLELVSLTEIASADAERQAHRVLEPYRSHGEWFDFGTLGDYVAGRLQRETSSVEALLTVLREIRDVVVPATRITCRQNGAGPPPNIFAENTKRI
jgi:hypothetical protein